MSAFLRLLLIIAAAFEAQSTPIFVDDFNTGTNIAHLGSTANIPSGTFGSDSPCSKSSAFAKFTFVAPIKTFYLFTTEDKYSSVATCADTVLVTEPDGVLNLTTVTCNDDTDLRLTQPYRAKLIRSLEANQHITLLVGSKNNLCSSTDTVSVAVFDGGFMAPTYMEDSSGTGIASNVILIPGSDTRTTPICNNPSTGKRTGRLQFVPNYSGLFEFALSPSELSPDCTYQIQIDKPDTCVVSDKFQQSGTVALTAGVTYNVDVAVIPDSGADCPASAVGVTVQSATFDNLSIILISGISSGYLILFIVWWCCIVKWPHRSLFDDLDDSPHSRSCCCCWFGGYSTAVKLMKLSQAVWLCALFISVGSWASIYSVSSYLFSFVATVLACITNNLAKIRMKGGPTEGHTALRNKRLFRIIFIVAGVSFIINALIALGQAIYLGVLLISLRGAMSIYAGTPFLILAVIEFTLGVIVFVPMLCMAAVCISMAGTLDRVSQIVDKQTPMGDPVMGTILAASNPTLKI